MIKKSNHLNRLVTLSPLTEMARKFHLHNGAVELQVNEDQLLKTLNINYKINFDRSVSLTNSPICFLI